VGEAGDLGQFTAYLPDSIDTKATGYVYSKFGKKVTFSHGSGAVGFRFYSMEDSLLSFCNTMEYSLPDEIATRELKIVAVSADGSESEVTTVYNGSEEVQIEALQEAFSIAAEYIKKKDTSGKKVGYIRAYALKTLNEYYNAAKAALADSSQAEHTYGEWAKLLSDEFDRIIADDRAFIKINPKNAYKLVNSKYSKYTAYCKNDGTMACAMNDGNNTKLTFVPVSGSDLYYIKNNTGKYIDYVSQSKDVTAKASSTSSAVKFKIHEMGNCRYAIQKENTSYGYLHCTSGYKLVGWKNEDATSQWTITCVTDNQATEDKAQLKAAIAEAKALLYEVVDTTSSTVENIVLYSYVETKDSNLPEYVKQLAEETSAAATLFAGGTTVLFPEASEKLAAAIALVRASYSIPTSIGSITIDEIGANDEVYDTTGRRVKVVTPGCTYIINGKKVYVK
jgi:hypothetical protein